MLETHRAASKHLSKWQASGKKNKEGRKGKAVPDKPKPKQMPGGKKARKTSIVLVEEEEEEEEEGKEEEEDEMEEAAKGQLSQTQGMCQKKKKNGELVRKCAFGTRVRPAQVRSPKKGVSFGMFKGTIDQIELGRKGGGESIVKFANNECW
jgi:hypothetical protein